MSTTMARTRDHLPKTDRFGDVETRILQNRHSALKHRMAKADKEFPWPTFREFFSVVMSAAPTDYVPSRYHLSWGEDGNDYRIEAMRFKRIGIANTENLAAELATLLTGLDFQEEEPAQLVDLVNTAAAHAA